MSHPAPAVTTPSFDEFYRTRFEGLARLGFLLVGSAHRADELAQDACEQVLRRWNQIENPAAYARLAVLNGARSAGRRRRVEARTPGDARPDAVLGPEAVAVRTALAQLPRRQREIVVLRYWADLPLQTIADELDVPLGTVKSHLHRALKTLHSTLEETP